MLEDSADEGVAELGSLQFPGSKKQNLNHLLNFHFADREQQRIRGRGNPHASGYHGSSQTVRPSHGKDSFIQAKYSKIFYHNKFKIMLFLPYLIVVNSL